MRQYSEVSERIAHQAANNYRGGADNPWHYLSCSFSFIAWLFQKSVVEVEKDVKDKYYEILNTEE